ncbi:MAG: hypothetical protein J6H31_12835 [Butyrivibrio sp.]|nr:hypothetical protein [Butyrivibrio sp.]
MRIAFWNTHKNEGINPIITKIIAEEKIDIMVLAEYCDKVSDLINSSRSFGNYNSYFTVGCGRITMIGKIENVEPGIMTDYFAIQIINNEILLCALHLNSNIYSNAQERRQIVLQDLKRKIENYKNDKKIDNVVILGDFNENPYDRNLMGVNGLNGVPVAKSIRKNPRIVAGISVDTYYNPMWNFLGDFNEPFGTYYYSTEAPFWNIYDQVLISASLVNRFCKDKIKILTRISGISIQKEDCSPNKSQYSDHFPILFEIKEAEI